MIYDKRVASNLIGCLIKKPEILSYTDKYLLTADDFQDKVHRILFSTVYNLFNAGAEKVDIDEINQYLKKYPELYNSFNEQKGNEFLLASVEMATLTNFDYYYDRLKKLSLLRSLKEEGIDVSEWYIEGAYDIAQRQVLEKKLEDTPITDIVAHFQNKLFAIESSFINKKNFQFGDMFEGFEELIESLKKEPDMGLPLMGDIFTTVCRGARKSKVFSSSGSTGSGKSRQAISAACKLAIPFVWDSRKEKWIINGSNQKVLFITTELECSEIQTIILANITGINEEKILNGSYSSEQSQRIKQGLQILEYFKDNFFIYHMPDPTINQLNNNVRRLAITKKIDAVFFDYIHSSPQLIAEFAGAKLREDVVLMMLSTALKNLANEMNVFVWTGTQLNAHGMEADFSDESSLRGSRAVADKLDFGMVLHHVTPEKLKIIKEILKDGRIRPNMYYDVYKNRRGRYRRVRIWVEADLGTARFTDLFLTDEFGNETPIDILATKDLTLDVDITEILSQTREEPEQPNKPKEIKITL